MRLLLEQLGLADDAEGEEDGLLEPPHGELCVERDERADGAASGDEDEDVLELLHGSNPLCWKRVGVSL